MITSLLRQNDVATLFRHHSTPKQHARRVGCLDITWRKFISQCKDLAFCPHYLWGKIDSQLLLRMGKCCHHLISRDLIWIMIVVWNYLPTESVIILAIRFAVFINCIPTEITIYIIISKNIRYLLWNRGARRFFHDTYLTIEVQGIRCTNHLHDSCPLTDVNPHFTAPGCRYYFKINSWWPIVTSLTHGPAASYCDVTMIHCSNGYLWTHDVEVDAS